ncbi:hypothetical protein [Tautonia marina]|uniref:hypothetical protein n=1 Tax=Tautonia marina TaxID=2653855 RepID=UPI001260D78C|nr:hypothetical protein [Tautonia marina]
MAFNPSRIPRFVTNADGVTVDRDPTPETHSIAVGKATFLDKVFMGLSVTLLTLLFGSMVCSVFYLILANFMGWTPTRLRPAHEVIERLGDRLPQGQTFHAFQMETWPERERLEDRLLLRETFQANEFEPWAQRTPTASGVGHPAPNAPRVSEWDSN